VMKCRLIIVYKVVYKSRYPRGVSVKTSPSQLRTRMARVNRTSYAVLLARAQANNSSVAEEIDKLLGMGDEARQVEFTVVPGSGVPQLQIMPMPAMVAEHKGGVSRE